MLATLFDGLPAVSYAVFAALALLSLLTLTVAIFKIIQFSRLGVGRHAAAQAVLDD